MNYTGSTSYRTVVKKSDALNVNGVPEAVIFWHGTDSKWVYTCPLGGDDFEVTCRIKEPGYNNRSSWGKEASIEHFRNRFSEFCPPIQQLLELATWVQQFDFFAGPRLDTVIKGASIALIGDASHPLSGAFGAGAGFALEDAYVLGGSIEWALSNNRTLTDALKLFDKVRSPHYGALYAVLDQFGEVERKLSVTTQTPSGEIESRIQGVWNSKHSWMYYHEVSSSRHPTRYGRLTEDNVTELCFQADRALADAIKESTEATGIEPSTKGRAHIRPPGVDERPGKNVRVAKL